MKGGERRLAGGKEPSVSLNRKTPPGQIHEQHLNEGFGGALDAEIGGSGAAGARTAPDEKAIHFSAPFGEEGPVSRMLKALGQAAKFIRGEAGGKADEAVELQEEGEDRPGFWRGGDGAGDVPMRGPHESFSGGPVRRLSGGSTARRYGKLFFPPLRGSFPAGHSSASPCPGRGGEALRRFPAAPVAEENTKAAGNTAIINDVQVRSRHQRIGRREPYSHQGALTAKSGAPNQSLPVKIPKRTAANLPRTRGKY